jgi:hypothetical protein
LRGTGTDTLAEARQLLYGRTFEGWKDSGHIYFELDQEFAHLAGIHWRPEEHAYCRFNDRGDLDQLVSVANRGDDPSGPAVVSFRWDPLEDYLVASDSVLVRMFDFTLFRSGQFFGWPEAETSKIDESATLFYDRRVVAGYAAFTRGVQVIRPRKDRRDVFARMTSAWFGARHDRPVEFLALDWRNDRVTTISTDPSATTNYFAAATNSLPYELSPAFFKPEVLLKYKGDREKYEVSERSVSCRASWYLEGIDVNDAGQVHAYICYLRRLPHHELLHWQAHNEAPRAGISARAITTDFKGEFVVTEPPLQMVLSIVRRWHAAKYPWWTLRDESLVRRVGVPLTTSRDEWGDSFMDLAKLVIEGFEETIIRERVRDIGMPFADSDKSIALLEKLVPNRQGDAGAARLEGLREVQRIRTKVRGHASGREARELAQGAIGEHASFANHFRVVCARVADDLAAIERALT